VGPGAGLQVLGVRTINCSFQILKHDPAEGQQNQGMMNMGLRLFITATAIQFF
jgi:hypothetical protein